MAQSIFHKTVCFNCKEEIVVPASLSLIQGISLYYHPQTSNYALFSWNENPQVQIKVSEILSYNRKVQFRNDETKGMIALMIVGLLADSGEWKLVTRNDRCPKCHAKLKKSNYILEVLIDLPKLSFTHLQELDSNEIGAKIKKQGYI